jgi:hypothetical protein
MDIHARATSFSIERVIIRSFIEDLNIALCTAHRFSNGCGSRTAEAVKVLLRHCKGIEDGG